MALLVLIVIAGFGYCISKILNLSRRIHDLEFQVNNLKRLLLERRAAAEATAGAPVALPQAHPEVRRSSAQAPQPVAPTPAAAPATAPTAPIPPRPAASPPAPAAPPREAQAPAPGRAAPPVPPHLPQTAAASAAPAQPRPPAELQPAAAGPLPPKPVVPPEPTASPPPRPAAPPPPPPAPRPAAPPSPPARPAQNWEVLIGGKWLNRIGAVALIIGVAFFFKYASDKQWITPTMKVLLGFLTGISLLAGGERSHRKALPVFAQGLIGAGISILYLSVYAGFNLYHLPWMSQRLAFVLMFLVTVLAFFEALRYDSLAVSLLGWLGGFLTPYLLATGEVRPVGLFTYVALLVAGLLAVVLVKQGWIVLEPLTLAATYGTYAFWYLRHYESTDLAVAVTFLSIFWGLFYALDVIRIARDTARSSLLDHVIAGLNAITYYWFMTAAIAPLHRNWMGSVTLAIGAVYFLTVLAFARFRAGSALARGRYAVTAIILMVLATYLEYGDRPNILIILWALEAFGLVACGVRWRIRYVWIPALSIFGLAIGRLCLWPQAFAYEPIETLRLILNERGLVFGALAGALAGSAVLFKRMDPEGRSPIWRVLHYTCCAVAFAFFTVETNDYFRRELVGARGPDGDWLAFARFITFPAVWMAYSIPLVWVGLRRRLSPLFTSGYCVLTLAVAAAAGWGLLYQPLDLFRLGLNYRALMLGAVIAGLAAHLLVLRGQRGEFEWVGSLQAVLHYTWCALAFLLCSVELNDLFRAWLARAHGADRARLAFTHLMTFPALWLLYSLPLAWVGLRKRMAPLYHAAWAALAAAVALAVVRGLWFEPLAQHGLALNVRAAVLALLVGGLMVHAFWLRTERPAYPWTDQLRGAMHFTWCALLFQLVTVETNDYFRRLLIEATGKDLIRLSFAHLMTFPAVWLLYSLPLVWFGIRKRLSALLCWGLGALALAVGLAGAHGAAYAPVQDFTLAFNLRAGVLLALLLGLAVHGRWLGEGREAYPWTQTLRPVLQLAWCGLLFELVTVEANDFFGRLLVQADAAERLRLEFLHHMTFPAVWLVYALPLIWLGLRKRLTPLLGSGLAALGLAVALAAFRGVSFEPIREFALAFNYRGAVLFSMILSITLMLQWLRQRHAAYPWIARLRPALLYTGCLLLFQLVTVEANDFFRHKLVLAGAAGPQHAYLSFTRFMVFPAVWVAYSLPLIFFGLRRKASPLLSCGFAALALGVGVAGVRGVAFAPIEVFALGLNPRAVVLGLLMLGLGLCIYELKDRGNEYPWGDKVALVMKVAIALLGLELVTVETHDHFRHLMAFAASQAGTAPMANRIAQLKNLHQLTLSLVWLLYSIALIGVGMWRRLLAFRIVAIMVFGISILKIFVYDLSFLETLYRIFSFIGLGAILLLVSYLYQRHKAAIFGTV